MKILPLIIITTIYLIVLSLYNYSLYKLLTNKNFGHQYYLILIYFICECFSIIYYFIPRKGEIIIGDINPYILTTELTASLSISDISNNNLSNIYNYSNSNISNIRNNSENSCVSDNNLSNLNSEDSYISKIPFVGIKCVSFILSSFLDFLSKLFIYNGIKYMNQDSILRCVFEMLIISCGSKLILKLKIGFYSLSGIIIIFLYLIISFCTQKTKENVIGILLFLEGGLANSIQYLIQAKFFLKGEQYIYRIITWEGLYGTLFSLFTLIISLIVSCPFEQNKNNIIDNKNNNFDNYYYDFFSFCNGNNLENNINSFCKDITNNLGWFILYFFSCMFYSFIGIFIIKYINIIYRVSLDTFRMLFFIIILLIKINDEE